MEGKITKVKHIHFRPYCSSLFDVCKKKATTIFAPFLISPATITTLEPLLPCLCRLCDALMSFILNLSTSLLRLSWLSSIEVVKGSSYEIWAPICKSTCRLKVKLGNNIYLSNPINGFVVASDEALAILPY